MYFCCQLKMDTEPFLISFRTVIQYERGTRAIGCAGQFRRPFFTISLPTLLLSFKAIKSNRNNNENIKKRKPSALKAIPLFVLFMCWRLNESNQFPSFIRPQVTGHWHLQFSVNLRWQPISLKLKIVASDILKSKIRWIHYPILKSTCLILK